MPCSWVAGWGALRELITFPVAVSIRVQGDSRGTPRATIVHLQTSFGYRGYAPPRFESHRLRNGILRRRRIPGLTYRRKVQRYQPRVDPV